MYNLSHVFFLGYTREIGNDMFETVQLFSTESKNEKLTLRYNFQRPDNLHHRLIYNTHFSRPTA